MKSLIDELEAMAKKATTGQWRYDYGNWEVEKASGRNPVCSIDNDMDEDFPRLVLGHNDGEHIALANPENILKLCAMVRDAERVLEIISKYCECDGTYEPCECSTAMSISASKALKKLRGEAK